MSTYWQYYDLEQDPFAPGVAPDPYYLSNQWQQLLELVTHLSENSESVLLVTGISGVGKTTLLREFIGRVSDRADICKVQGDSSLTPDVLRYLLAKHLGFAFSDGRRETFNQQLTAQLKQMRGQHYLLVIDDAHLVPEKTLAALLDIATQQPEDNQPLHVVLFGGPQVEATVADMTAQHLGEGVTHTSRIKPMDGEIIREYIQHRLSSAGLKQTFPLNESELAEIFQHSAGVPAKVNFYARQLLEAKAATDQEKKSQRDKPTFKIKLPKKCLFYGLSSIVGVALIGLALMNFLGDEPQAEHIVIEQLMDDFRRHTSADFAELSVSDELNITALHETADQEPFVTESMEMPEDFDEEVVQAEEEDLPEGPSTHLEEQPMSVQTSKSAAVENESESVLEQSVQEPLPSEGPVDSVVLLENQQLFVTDPAVLAGEKSQVDVDEKFKPSSLRSMRKTGEKTLPKVNPNHYTLQLMGAYDKQHLEHFVSANHLGKKVSYFHTHLNGKDWYVVTYGEYDSAQDARGAIHELPQVVQREHPWTRQLSSVGQPIKKSNV